MVDRRRFLLGAGALILTAPTLSTLTMPEISVLNPFDLLAGTKPYPVNRRLDWLLRASRTGNPFVARAASKVKVRPMQLLPAPAALESIFDNLGIDWSFSDRVCYCEASQCKNQFSAQERQLRPRYNAFAGINRSPEDSDVAYLAAKNSNESEAAAATQFRDYEAVKLSGDDPGVIGAAAALLKRKFQPDSREVARSFAVTNIEDWSEEEDGPVVGRRYETPVHSIIHDHRARADAPRGVLSVLNNQAEDDVVYFGALYA